MQAGNPEVTRSTQAESRGGGAAHGMGLMYCSGNTSFRARAPIAHDIAVVLHDFSSGGSERVAVRLANAWASAGRQVRLFCGRDEGPLRALVAPAVAVAPIAPCAAAGRGSRRELGRALAGMVRDFRPDVVVGPGNSHVPLLAAMLADLDWDRPAVACKLSNPLAREDRSWLRQRAFAWQFRRRTARFDALVAMSPAFAAEAAVLLRRRDIACVSEPTLDRMPRPAARAATGTVVCVGRLTRQKNFALALDAFARADRSARLVILGEGAEEAALRARAASLGIAGRVTFAGFVHDVGAHLAQADALLCTSRFEGYPAALVEALAAGLPVVSTPCSLALPEILLDRSFGAIAPARPAELAAALDTVLRQRRRPAAAPLAELGRRHQIGRSAQEWLAVLDRAVAARAGAMVAA